MKRRHGRSQDGFTYVVILVLLAVVALAAALTLEIAHTSARRAAEAELLAIGEEFERAFASYYRQSTSGGPRFPNSLDDLTRDPRVPGIRRHLRRVYVDPLTGGVWGTVPAPGGGIMAVYSTSQDQPFRENNGPLLAQSPASIASDAGTARSYSDWRFGYDPSATALRAVTGKRFVKP
jgi:type II secretory pathway pseudopilin PulG